jgi:hypothetical protein
MNTINNNRLHFAGTLSFVAVALLTLLALSPRVSPNVSLIAIPSAITVYIAVALWTAPRFVRVVSLILLLSGLALLPTTSEPAALWAEALNRNSELFVLFLAVPLLGGALVHFPEKATLETQRDDLPTTTGRRLLQMLSIAIVQFLMSVIVSIGSIWITVPVFRRDGFRRDTIHRGTTLGYSINVTISPFDVVLHTVMLLGGITYYQLLPGAVGISVLYLASFSLHEYIVSRRSRQDSLFRGPQLPSFLQRGKSRRLFLVHISILMSVTTGATYLFQDQSGAVVTGITGILYAFSWIILVSRKGAPEYIYHRLQSEIPRFTGFLPLLIAATFFGAIVPQTSVTEFVPSLEGIFLAQSTYLAILLLVAGTAVLAAAGIHMLVTVVLAGSILSPELFNLSPLGFTLMLMVAYVSAMNLSPVVPFTVVLGAANGQLSPFSVIRDNWFSWFIIVLGAPLLLLFLYGK